MAKLFAIGHTDVYQEGWNGPERRPSPGRHDRSPMDKFVKRENIRHYRKMLEQATDEAERRRLSKLLADEEGRDSLDAPHRPGGEGR